MSSTRLLFLTRYARSGASSRYRTFQYLPNLEKAGIYYEVSPLFDDEYLNSRYRSQSIWKHAVGVLLRRFKSLLNVRQFDLIVIEYEILAYFPALFERLLKRIGVPYVVDYDDALFHRYDQHPNPLIRSLLGNKIAAVMRNAKLVIAGNNYLAEYALQAGAKQVEVIPTVIDLARYPLSMPPPRGKNDRFTIGWIGSPTSAVYLLQIAQALTGICRDGKSRLRLIGSGPIELPGVDLEVLPWSEESEVNQMHSFDVGIMPLRDDPWARGKCGLKLIQYMGCGLAVVASPVGVNSDIIEHGKNGFLASTQDEWQQAIEGLAYDTWLRKRMGACGRRKVEQYYCLQVTASRLTNLFISAAGKNRPCVE